MLLVVNNKTKEEALRDIKEGRKMDISPFLYRELSFLKENEIASLVSFSNHWTLFVIKKNGELEVSDG